MSTPRWTPEEIAALEEGLRLDAADRERLEAALASDPEAKALFDALRADHTALDEALDTGLAGMSDLDFVTAVMEQLDEQPRRVPASMWRWVLGAALIPVALLIIPSPRETPPGVAAPDSASEVASAQEAQPMEDISTEDTRVVASGPVPEHSFEIMSNVGTWEPEQFIVAMPAEVIEEHETPDVVVQSLITDDTGQPLQGAEVRVTAYPNRLIALGHTAPDGTAVLGAISPSPMHALFFRATHPGRAAQEIEVSDWDVNEVVELALPPAETLIASVVDSNGFALSGFTVRTREREQAHIRQGTLAAQTDTDGKALFANLTDQEQVLSVFDKENRLLASAFVAPALRAQVEITVLPTEGFEVTGQVTGVVTGAPVSGARVQIQETGDHPGAGSISRRHAWTDAEGRYSFEALRPDISHTVKVDYHVTLDGSDPWQVEGIELTEKSPTAQAGLVALEPFTFTGRVIDATTGEAIPSLEVHLTADLRHYVTDENGQLVLNLDVWEGMLDLGLSVMTPGWQPEEPDPYGRARTPIFVAPDPLSFDVRLVPSGE